MFASLKRKDLIPEGENFPRRSSSWWKIWKKWLKSPLWLSEDNLFAWRYIGFVSENVSKWAFPFFVYFETFDVFGPFLVILIYFQIKIKALRLMCDLCVHEIMEKHSRKQWKTNKFLSLNEDNMVNNNENVSRKKVWILGFL